MAARKVDELIGMKGNIIAEKERGWENDGILGEVGKLEAIGLHPEQHNEDDLRVILSDVPRPTEEDSELMGHYPGGDTARAITVRTKAQIDGLTNADEPVGELARPRVASRIRPTRGRLRADESAGELARPRAASRTRPIRGRLRRGIDVGRCIQAGLRRRP